MTISSRRQRTRTALQEAALVVFARRGVAGASIEEICEEGGFTRGAFYSNYATKDDLILEIIDQQYAQAVAGASGLAEQLSDGRPCAANGPLTDDGPEAALRSALDQFAIPFTTTPARIIAMQDIELHSLRHPPLRTRLDAVQRSHEERLTSVVSGIIDHYRARAIAPVPVIIEACRAVYERAAQQAVAAHPDAEELDVDRSTLLAVLLAFIVFPKTGIDFPKAGADDA